MAKAAAKKTRTARTTKAGATGDAGDTTGHETSAGEAGGVAAVNRALSILDAFEQSVDGMTLTDLMNATGLYHSTILRLCESLENYRYLKRLPDGRYMLGPMPFYLGTIYQASFHLRDYALPILRDLSMRTHETSAIYVRDGNDRICLHRIELPRRVRMNVQEGDRIELDKGAAGKVLLAFSGEPGKVYEEIRQLGYSISLAERDSESAGIAAPVFGTGQRIVAAISLGVPLFRFDEEAFAACLPQVRDAARRLTHDLGGDTASFHLPAKRLAGLKLPTKRGKGHD